MNLVGTLGQAKTPIQTPHQEKVSNMQGQALPSWGRDFAVTFLYWFITNPQKVYSFIVTTSPAHFPSLKSFRVIKNKICRTYFCTYKFTWYSYCLLVVGIYFGIVTMATAGALDFWMVVTIFAAEVSQHVTSSLLDGLWEGAVLVWGQGVHLGLRVLLLGYVQNSVL